MVMNVPNIEINSLISIKQLQFFRSKSFFNEQSFGYRFLIDICIEP